MKKITDRIALILNVLAAGALLFSYLSPLVNPAKIFLPALFGLAYPYLLMLNLLFVAFWMIRLDKLIILSLLVILLGWNHLNNFLPLGINHRQAPKDSANSEHIKVMSYNIHGFDLYRKGNDPKSRKQIFDFIEEHDPQIVCFQEYYSSGARGENQNNISGQLSNLKYQAVFYTSDPANLKGFGIATFSKYPIIKRSRIPFNQSANSAMYTDLDLGRDTIRVFNIHLQSIRFQEENYAFMDTMRLKYSTRQMKEIKSISSRLKAAYSLRAEQAQLVGSYIEDSPYPVLVMGDFNDTPQSFAYRRISRGLKDAFRKAGRGFGNTYAGELPSFRIDYIMYSPPMVPYEFKRIKNDFSDHFPVTGWMLLPLGTTSE